MIKVLELFAGIGACSKALEHLNIDHEIVDAVEIDKYAIASFNAIHGTNFEAQDITKWTKDIACDLIMHGSPCQDFSIAGRGAGGDEGSGTRSSLMYETLRIVEKLRPKYVIWENVKNILSQKHRANFEAYRNKMMQMGYSNYSAVLNARDYGVPQNRERVYTVSILGNEEFWFPKPMSLTKALEDCLEDHVDEKYYLSQKCLDCFLAENTGAYPRRERFLQNINRKNKDIANSITTRAGSRPTDNFVAIPIRTDNKTITTGNGMGVLENCRLRKLTPKECWRLMGFDDEDFDKASKINSNAQLYKQVGNSIVVNVLEGILRNLLEVK